MKDTILSILNENSAELTVEKAMKIAAAQMVVPISDISPNDLNANERWIAERDSRALDILQSFESFKKIRLEKGQFVCEVDKPDVVKLRNWDYKSQTEIYEITKTYELALQKVIFAGFEKDNSIPKYHQETDRVVMVGGSIRLHLFTNINEVQLYIYGFRLDIAKCTIGDLLTEISRYNRTAKEPINLKFTENILPLLGVKI